MKLGPCTHKDGDVPDDVDIRIGGKEEVFKWWDYRRNLGDGL